MKRKLIKNLLLVLTLVVLCLAVGMTASAETWGDYSYKVLDNETVEITGYIGEGGKVEIPSEIDGKTVTSIGKNVFDNCSVVTSIIIPESVEVIGYKAIFDCKNLTNVHLGSGVKEIGDGVFNDCVKFSNITVDEDNINFSNSEDGLLLSKDKTVLIKQPLGKQEKQYIIPDSVTCIKKYAFAGSISPKCLVIPKTVKTVESYAFCECYGITDIVIENGVETIEKYAFLYLPFLETVTIKSMDVDLGRNAICVNDYKYVDISHDDFMELVIQALSGVDVGNELYNHMVAATGNPFMIGTIYCHAGSTAEAYAIENGCDYVLTHFYEDEWTYDYDNLVRYRKCIHCDELETEAIEPEVPTEPETPETPADPEVPTNPVKNTFGRRLIELIKSIFELVFSFFKI